LLTRRLVGTVGGRDLAIRVVAATRDTHTARVGRNGIAERSATLATLCLCVISEASVEVELGSWKLGGCAEDSSPGLVSQAQVEKHDMPHNERKVIVIGRGIAGLCAGVYARKCGIV